MPPSYNEVIADPSYNQPHAYNVHQQLMAPDHQVPVQAIPTQAYNVHQQPMAPDHQVSVQVIPTYAYNVQHQPMAPDHQVPVQVIPTHAYNVHHQPIASGQFDEQPKLVTCPACFHQVTTVVDSGVSTSGLMWVIVCCLLGSGCCLLGSWISNYLVICFPGFRKYTHTCPKCRAIIAQTEPKHTTSQLVTIILTSIGVIGLALLIVILCYPDEEETNKALKQLGY